MQRIGIVFDFLNQRLILMPEDLNEWDIKSLNQLFISLNKRFRHGLKARKNPDELLELQHSILGLHKIMCKKIDNTSYAKLNSTI